MSADTLFKPALQLQSRKPQTKSVISHLPDTTSDASEARYWAEKLGLGPVSGTARTFAHPRQAMLAAGSSSIVHELLFEPNVGNNSKRQSLAVVCGPRVQLYGTTPHSTLHQVLHYRHLDNRPEIRKITECDRQVQTGGQLALTAAYRSDGRLLAVGTDQGQIRIAEADKRMTVRTFTAVQNLAIRAVQWFRNGQDILSAGDDAILRVWKLQQQNDEKAAIECVGHGDSIRSAALWQLPAKEPDKWPLRSLVATGSYDHTVRLWNMEEAELENRSVAVLMHGAPVEVVKWLPSDNPQVPTWLVSAGGTVIKIWNPLTGICVSTVQAHHRKTICSLVQVNRIDGEFGEKYPRIMTAGLDGLLRIHAWNNKTGALKHLTGIPLNVPITALAVTNKSDRIAIGTAEGNVLIKQKGPSVQSTKRKAEPRAGTYSFFTRGMNADPVAGDFVVGTEGKKRKLRKFDLSLKQFRYGDALDEALETRTPQVVVAVLEELGKRRGLNIALSNRDEESLEPILSFTVRYIGRPRFSSLLIGVAHKLIDIYGGVAGQSEMIDELFNKLRSQVITERRAQESLLRVAGQLEAIMASSEVS